MQLLPLPNCQRTAHQAATASERRLRSPAIPVRCSIPEKGFRHVRIFLTRSRCTPERVQRLAPSQNTDHNSSGTPLVRWPMEAGLGCQPGFAGFSEKPLPPALWRWGDSNPRHRGCKPRALPLSYIPSSLAPASGRTWIRTKDLSFIRAAL